MNALRAAWEELRPGLDLRVAPDDELIHRELRAGRDPAMVLADYLRFGAAMTDVVSQTLASCGLVASDVDSLVEVAAGHGRCTRFLLREWPRDRVSVCALTPSALRFQTDELGVRAAATIHDLGATEFDVVCAFASFVTLSESPFVTALRELVARLSPNGVIVLSTRAAADGAGFQFDPGTEPSSLVPEGFGATRVSADWFERTVRGIEGVRCVRRAPRALEGSLDVWSIRRAPEQDGVPLPLVAPPHVEIDSTRIEPTGRFSIAGWALDGRRHPAKSLTVRIGARSAAAERRQRPDVATHFGAPQAVGSGFELVHDLNGERWPHHVVVSAHADDGSHTVRVAPLSHRRAPRVPTEAESAVLARMRRGREVLAYGGLFSVCEADVHEGGLYPHLAVRAEGCRLWDATDREYLDWFLGWGPMLLGHRRREVEAAIERQLRVAPALSLMHDLEIEVAEQLSRMIPCAERVAFGKNGSDVTLAAVRAARAITGRELVFACGYHGFHDWSMAQYAWCAGVPTVMRECSRTFPYNDLEALRRLLELDRGKVAAIILEPTANELPATGFLAGVKRLAEQHGAVLIFDEIVTGFRLARGGAQEAYGVVPDLACFGKSLANGLPLSALVGRSDVMRVLPSVGFGLTFRGELLRRSSGAPTSCACCRASALD